MKNFNQEIPQDDDYCHQSSIRFLHNVFGAPNVDIYVDKAKKPVVKNLRYQEYTGYIEFSSSASVFVVKVAGTNTVLVSKKIRTENSKYYTSIVTGDVNN